MTGSFKGGANTLFESISEESSLIRKCIMNFRKIVYCTEGIDSCFVVEFPYECDFVALDSIPL
jgi:hypothetical protein